MAFDTIVRTKDQFGLAMKYQALTMKDLLFHVRMALHDGEEKIGVFHGDKCVGIWAIVPGGYMLVRPNSMLFWALEAALQNRD